MFMSIVEHVAGEPAPVELSPRRQMAFERVGFEDVPLLCTRSSAAFRDEKHGVSIVAAEHLVRQRWIFDCAS
jgi:hypothetical protein